jgi:hypothetical protein
MNVHGRKHGRVPSLTRVEHVVSVGFPVNVTVPPSMPVPVHVKSERDP